MVSAMQNSMNKIKTDQKCIWMLAGVISYKLCDRDFQCEKCEFDKVMRGMLPPHYNDAEAQKDFFRAKSSKDATSQLINQYLYSLFSDCKIHLDRCYHPSHFWYKAESESTILVGIDRLLIKIMEPIDKIILPEVGQTYRKGQLIAWIVRKGKTLPLHSPVKGKVVGTNSLFLLSGVKQVLKNDAYYFKMEEEGLRDEIQQLCDNIHGLQFLMENVYIVRKYLDRTFNQHHTANVGTTLADGGRIQICLEKVIGEKAFQKLLNNLFT
jgi:glycine cleavage system H lipoate-binding protein